MIADALRYQASVRGELIALRDGDRRWTFAELADAAAALATALLRWQSTAGRLALLCANKAEHIIALLAVAATPHAVVVLDPKWSTDEIQRALAAFAPQLLMVDADDPRADGLLADLPGLRLQDALRTEGEREELRSRAHRDDDYLLAPSGGTSGKLKGARLSHAATVSRFVTQQVEFRIEPGDSFLVCTPLFHGSARSHALSHLYFGASVRVLPGFTPEGFRAHVQEATATFCVPTMLSRIVELDGVWNPRLNLIAGGAAVPTDLQERIRERVTPKLYNYYAAVEAGPIAITRPQESNAAAAHGSVGRPVFGARVSILDPDADGVGNVLVQADFLASGLEGDVDAAVSARLREERAYLTGDLGRLGSDGQLVLHGRADDVIITGGVNVQPKEVETGLREVLGHPEVCVLGVEDAEWGQKVVAVVRAPEAERIDYERAKQMLRQRMSAVKVPKEIVWVDEMPLTSMGKINRRALVDRVAKRMSDERN